MTGQTIGPYRVLREVGKGGMGAVYEAIHPQIERKVAIKVALGMEGMGEEEARRFEKLFLNEAAMVGKLSHPNIVGVYDAVVEGDMRAHDVYSWGAIHVAGQMTVRDVLMTVYNDFTFEVDGEVNARLLLVSDKSSDYREGEIGVAIVVVREGAPAPTLEELRAHGAERLARWKLPEALVVVDTLPLTPMQKLDRAALASAAQAGTPVSSVADTADERQ